MDIIEITTCRNSYLPLGNNGGRNFPFGEAGGLLSVAVPPTINIITKKLYT